MRRFVSLRSMHSALVVAAVALHGGCRDRDVGGPEVGPQPLPPVPDICDGSDEIRLYVADWYAGSADSAVDFVMYAEGMRFLKIDGHCHYYVYDGETRRYRWWEPVMEGDFTPDELADVVERLQVARWGTFEEEDLVWPNMHAAWNRFHVAGEEHTCPYGCQGEVAVMLYQARLLTEELARVSEPVVPETLEAVVIERHRDSSHWPFFAPWQASTPMEDWIEPPVLVDFFQEGPELMGTLVRAADEPWFVEMTDAYREAAPPNAPTAVGIEDENGEVWHALYVRTVVPAFGEARVQIP